jgi:hypothetical protein
MVKTTNSLDINWKTGGGDQRLGGYMKMVKQCEGTNLGRRLKLLTGIQFKKRESIKVGDLQTKNLGLEAC